LFLYLSDEKASLIVIFSLGKSTIWSFYKFIKVVYGNYISSKDTTTTTNNNNEINSNKINKVKELNEDRTEEYDKTAVRGLFFILVPLAWIWAHFLLTTYKYKR
jgi:hypothetical protein